MVCKMDDIINKLQVTNFEKSEWEHILDFVKYDRNKETYDISASQIKKAKSTWKGKHAQFEPRLLCKMDTFESRPTIFKQLGIFLLSIKNGLYKIVKEDIYIHINIYQCPFNIIKRQNISKLFQLGNSESSMIDNLRYHGIFDKILGEEILYGSLLSGRHRCSFKTMLGDIKLDINGSQYETDGCYETENIICIIEAKSRCVESFNIRQLYYPYRSIYDKIGDEKQIVCLYIFKDKYDIIHIYEYEWTNPLKMMDVLEKHYYKYKFN